MQTLSRSFQGNQFNILFNLVKRNFLVFLKNKIRLLYTLLVPIIIFIVYLIFLRSMEFEMIKSSLKDLGLVSGTEWIYPSMEKSVFIIMDSWMMSGIIGISAITISIQTNNILVNDKENGVNRDFISSPINKKTLILSYFIFNFVITSILCLIFLAVCLVYLAIMGEFVVSFLDVLVMVGMTLFTVISCTLITIFICSFIKREPTLASIIAVFSSAIGFLVGAYMPLGLFPEVVENICCLIPGTHSVALMRYSFLNTPMNNFINEYQNKMNPTQFNNLMDQINKYGYNLKFFGGNTIVPWMQAVISVGVIVLFLILNLACAKHTTDIENK